MKFTFVTGSHPINQELDEDSPRPPSLPVEIFRTLKRWGMGQAQQAVIATVRGKIVGFFRFEAEDRSHTTLYAYGTWVAKSHRGKKLALKMWEKVLHRTTPEVVVVTAVSRGGAKLVRALKRRYTESCKWKFNDYSV